MSDSQQDIQHASQVNDGPGSDNGQKSGKKKFGGKGIRTYILCGFVSTCILNEVLMTLVCGTAGYLLTFPLSALNESLFGSVLGFGGTALLKEYSIFVGLALSFLLMLFIVKPWRPYLKAFGTGPSGNRVSLLLLGLLIGFAMNGVCIVGAVLAGSVQIEFVRFSIVGFVVFLVYIFIQATTEELLCRGFAYQRLNRTYGTLVAVIGSSVIFSLGHIFNPGVTPMALLDIFLTGVLYALMVRYCDSIWMAMGAHTAWNFTQNVLFGLPNSGMASSYSIFGLAGATSNSFAYDTAFGVEGTVLAVALNAICIVALYLWGRSRGKKKPYDIWQGSALEASQQEASVVVASAAGTAGVGGVEAAGLTDAASGVGASVVAGSEESASKVRAPKKRWFY